MIFEIFPSVHQIRAITQGFRCIPLKTYTYLQPLRKLKKIYIKCKIKKVISLNTEAWLKAKKMQQDMRLK